MLRNEWTPDTEHSGYYDREIPVSVTRHNLAHWYQDNVYVFVTWRLADSLPNGVAEQIRSEQRAWILEHPEPWTPEIKRERARLFSGRIDRLLDGGAGSCLLMDPAASAVVSETLKRKDGEAYDLEAYVVMPNHVHVLFRPLGVELSKTVQAWKSVSSRKLSALGALHGTVWQADYWDRLVRNGNNLLACRRYIESNPEKANLKQGQFDLWLRPRGEENAWQ